MSVKFLTCFLITTKLFTISCNLNEYSLSTYQKAPSLGLNLTMMMVKCHNADKKIFRQGNRFPTRMGK